MKKLALLMVLCLLVSSIVPAFAEETIPAAEEIAVEVAPVEEAAPAEEPAAPAEEPAAPAEVKSLTFFFAASTAPAEPTG